MSDFKSLLLESVKILFGRDALRSGALCTIEDIEWIYTPSKNSDFPVQNQFGEILRIYSKVLNRGIIVSDDGEKPSVSLWRNNLYTIYGWKQFASISFGKNLSVSYILKVLKRSLSELLHDSSLETEKERKDTEDVKDTILKSLSDIANINVRWVSGLYGFGSSSLDINASDSSISVTNKGWTNSSFEISVNNGLFSAVKNVNGEYNSIDFGYKSVKSKIKQFISKTYKEIMDVSVKLPLWNKTYAYVGNQWLERGSSDSYSIVYNLYKTIFIPRLKKELSISPKLSSFKDRLIFGRYFDLSLSDDSFVLVQNDMADINENLTISADITGFTNPVISLGIFNKYVDMFIKDYVDVDLLSNKDIEKIAKDFSEKIKKFVNRQEI